MGPKKALVVRAGPPQNHVDRPIPFQDNIGQDTKDAFLPYLARGFTPVETPGKQALECGYHALAISLQAAMRMLELPNHEDVTVDALKAMLKSKEFRADFVDPKLREDPWSSMPAQEINRQRKIWYSSRNLDINMMHWLLQLANREYGTNFDLGVIFQGYRCRWDDVKQDYDLDFYLPHTINTIASGGITNRPVLWVWNDQATARTAAHQSQPHYGHWEGFADSDQRGPGREKRVREWGLGSEVRADIEKNQVYRVTRDLPRPGEPNNALEVYHGAFVRKYEAETPIDGCSYVRTCQRGPENTGIVQDGDITLIELHEHAPLEFDIVASMADFAAADKEEVIVNQILNTGYAIVPLKIFRVVPGTSKIGEQLPPGNNAFQILIGDNEINTGDFLLEDGIGNRNIPSAGVTDINGVPGQAHLRRLQLLQTPWGLPAQTAVLPDDVSKLRIADLDKILKNSGLPLKGTKAVKVERINSLATGLPLYRLNIDNIHTSASNVDFHPQEIVLLKRRFVAEDQEMAQVIDFENHSTDVAFDRLVKIERAFGLRISGEVGSGIPGGASSAQAPQKASKGASSSGPVPSNDELSPAKKAPPKKSKAPVKAPMKAPLKAKAPAKKVAPSLAAKGKGKVDGNEKKRNIELIEISDSDENLTDLEELKKPVKRQKK